MICFVCKPAYLAGKEDNNMIDRFCLWQLYSTIRRTYLKKVPQ